MSGGDEEGDPGHGDEHGGGKVDGEDEGTQGARKLHLKAVHRVVACKNVQQFSLNGKQLDSHLRSHGRQF